MEIVAEIGATLRKCGEVVDHNSEIAASYFDTIKNKKRFDGTLQHEFVRFVTDVEMKVNLKLFTSIVTIHLRSPLRPSKCRH